MQSFNGFVNPGEFSGSEGSSSVVGSLASALGGGYKATNFYIDAGDYLGMNHEKFKTKLLQLALSKPEHYFKLREHVLDQVKKAAVESSYKIYYALLHDGKGTSGSNLGATVPGLNLGDFFKPAVPMQECNKFALSVAKTVDEIAERAVEMLIPMDYKALQKTE